VAATRTKVTLLQNDEYDHETHRGAPSRRFASNDGPASSIDADIARPLQSRNEISTRRA
jgi:hypothetical protein